MAASAIFLFLVANRGAYQGYFSGDDLDNLRWTRPVPLADFAVALLSPRYYPNNFRPVGHGIYHVMGWKFGLSFPPYAALIHLLHGLNCLLLWLLIRRLASDGGQSGLQRAAAVGAGVLFFGFHAVTLDAFWKPMYVFDLTCATLTLLCLLSYDSRRYVVSFAAFWVAIKAKELAVMLPLVLLAYECWLGDRRWKRLAPFFAASALIGMQALWTNRAAGEAYSLRLSPSTLAETAAYYAQRIMPWAWLAVPLVAAPVLLRDKRIGWGYASFAALLAPLLLLPGRMAGAYLYVPFAGLAVAVTAMLLRAPRPLGAIAVAAWLPLNYYFLRDYRRAELTNAWENRRYMESLMKQRAEMAGVKTFLYDGYPQTLNWWGILGGLRIALDSDEIRLQPLQDANMTEVLAADGAALLMWDPAGRELSVVVRRPGDQEASYLTLDRRTPVWQLGEGWYQLEHGYRWIKPRATARLRRPANAERFEIYVNVGPDYIRSVGRSHVEVLVNGERLGAAEFTAEGWQRRSWPLPRGPAGPADVEIRVLPEFRPDKTDPRALGTAIGGFGFRP